MRLEQRKALITGTGAGIGREIAKRFAAEGAHVVCVDWNESSNQETAALIRLAGAPCEALKADVSSAVDVRRVFHDAGPIEILVNNAASAEGDAPAMELSEENWDRVLSICLKSVFLCTREALKSMVPRGRGSIINLSSVNAIMGINLTAYTAAKGGILSLTRLIAAHYGPYGIRANAISPGTIMSEASEAFYHQHPEIADQLRALYPAGKFGRVEDVAACAVFLASDDSAFINGISLPVDGGLTAACRIPILTPKREP